MLRPLGKNILVQKKKEEQKPGKLILSDDSSKPFEAKIIGIGEKVEINVSVGEILLVVPYSGSRISADDDGYLLVTERDVLGVIG